MGKMKNKWIDQQEEQETIVPDEWDAAFPKNADAEYEEYIDHIAREHDAYMNQSCEFDW